MSKKKNTYEVGYKKPPEESKFKPGISGNPSGRPRKTYNFEEQFSEILNEDVSYIENGQRTISTNFSLIIRKIVIEAQKGNVRCQRMILDYISKIQTPVERENGSALEMRSGMTAAECAVVYKQAVEQARRSIYPTKIRKRRR